MQQQKKMINAQDGILQLNIWRTSDRSMQWTFFSTFHAGSAVWTTVSTIEQDITGVLNSNLHWRLVLVLPHN